MNLNVRFGVTINAVPCKVDLLASTFQEAPSFLEGVHLLRHIHNIDPGCLLAVRHGHINAHPRATTPAMSTASATGNGPEAYKLVVDAALGGDDELLEIAKELEEIALTDDFFIERKLYPNVDFYSGITLSAMGFPTTMFTVLFALGRMPGWIAHWREMREDPSTKINRPRQVYTGPAERSFTPISRR